MHPFHNYDGKEFERNFVNTGPGFNVYGQKIIDIPEGQYIIQWF
jgi:hypothetical protein